jgi:hypothetical protein
VFEWLSDLYKSKVSPKLGSDLRSANDMVGNTVGMALTLSEYSAMKDPLIKQNFGNVGVPVFKSGAHVSNVWVESYSINANSEHKEVAWKVLKHYYMDDTDASRAFFKIGQIASKQLAGQATDDPFMQVKYNELNYVVKGADQLNANWTPLMFGEYGSRFDTIFDTEDQNIQQELTDIANSLVGKLAIEP